MWFKWTMAQGKKTSSQERNDENTVHASLFQALVFQIKSPKALFLSCGARMAGPRQQALSF